jgi:hypothetical protein
VYQDSSGASALQIAEDSATRFAEVLQCIGYEVRPRKNARRKYIMDDLSDENLAVLRDVYDTVPSQYTHTHKLSSLSLSLSLALALSRTHTHMIGAGVHFGLWGRQVVPDAVQ